MCINITLWQVIVQIEASCLATDTVLLCVYLQPIETCTLNIRHDHRYIFCTSKFSEIR